MIKLIKHILFISAAAVFFSSCSTTRSLKEGQKLYIGSDVTVKKYDCTKLGNKELEEELEALIRPRPNSKILGVPVKLMIFNAIGEPEKKDGFWARMRNKYGEPPVTISDAAFEKNRQIIGNRLENRGYFYNTVVLDSVVKDKKIKGLFDAYVGNQYTFRNYQFTLDSNTIGKDIARIARWLPRARKGDPYSLETIKADRQRIDDHLKQRGYYYFNPDYLIAYIDSTVGDHQVDVDYQIKVGTPPSATKPYRIKNIYVFADFNLAEDTSFLIDEARLSSSLDTSKHLHIIDPKNKFKASVFERTLGFKPGDLYNRSSHSLALNRLTNLGVFKFVRATFENEGDSAVNQWLNTFYFLTPEQKKSIKFEVSGFVKSNNSNGAELSVNWRNRNLFRGAEDFRVRAYGSIEQQVMSGIKNIGTRKIGGEATLAIPRFVGPFKFKSAEAFLPKTQITLGYERFIRTDQYSLNSFNANYAYIWKPKIETEHKLDVLNIVYVRPSNIDSLFQKRLDTNVILRRSIEQQFIIGSIHNFTYSSLSLANNRRKHNFYLNTNVDIAGNLLGLITKANAANDDIQNIFKIPFAQYIRGEIDFRHYLRITRTLQLASRAIVGAGYAYGNSQTLPFVKSFFAGGPNDLRAFQIRSVGPGSYYAGNPRLNRIYVGDQPGEMKILLSSEIRKKFGSYIEVAGFVDMGNTWLLREDPTRPGGKISSNFLKELTIGAGPGLRVDLSILLLRLDIGVPLRGPVHGENRIDWNFNRMNWDWLQKNWVWNISIGYPF